MTMTIELLRKELLEIRRSKKILLFGLMGAFIPISINSIIFNPLISLDNIFLLFAIISSCMSGELVFYETVGEVHSKAFDIVLIATSNLSGVICCKLLLPAALTSISVTLGLLINDFVAPYITIRTLYVGAFSLRNILASISAAFLVAILDFALMSLFRKEDLKLHTALIVIVSLFEMALFSSTQMLTCWIPFALSGAGFILLVKVVANTLKKPRINPTFKGLRRIPLIPNHLHFKTAVVLIDLYAAPSWILFLVRWGSLLLVLGYSLLFPWPLYLLILFLVLSFGIAEVFYPNLIRDKGMGTMDVLCLAARRGYGEVIFSKGILSIVISQINISVACILTEKVFAISIGKVLLAFELFVILGMFICLYISNRYVQNWREFRIGKALIYLGLALFYAIMILLLKGLS